MRIVVSSTTVLGQRVRPVISGLQGEPGAPAKVGFSVQVSGIIPALNPILTAPLILAGNGIFDPAVCYGQSFAPCTSPITWSVTLDGTFVSENVASPSEIAAALLATIAFPAGPGDAVWDFPAGGAFSDGQVLRIWQSASGPDATQNLTSLTFAGD